MTPLLRKRRWMHLVMMLLVCTGFTALGWAQQEVADEKAKELEKKRAVIKAVKEALEGSTWQITLTQSGGTDNKKSTSDTLIFEGGKVRCKKMVDEGFPQSNFSVRVKDKLVVWETMQTSEKKGIAFWRGELEQGVAPTIMRGVLSHQIDEKTTQDYYFISEEKEGALKLVIQERQTTAPPVAPAPDVNPAPVAPTSPAPQEPASLEPEKTIPEAAPVLEQKTEIPASNPVSVPVATTVQTETKSEKKKGGFFFWKR
ncbi:MAG: hypothetical protein V1727_06075 [Candidatus Omnitrophota bacterium]